jgi:hypothetical protein
MKDMVCRNGNTLRLGTFKTPEEASLAYETASRELYDN